MCVFKTFSKMPIFQANPLVVEIEEATKALMADISRTNKEVFRRCKLPHPKASPWWNVACTIATQNLHQAQTTRTRGLAQVRLKGTVCTEK